MPKQKLILKGIGASPGVVTGGVRIIHFLEEISDMSKKDILVISFLTPDFFSLVRRNSWSLGVVTDKGGLTCHAAIGLRELKIPFVAGTKNATKKLKNNMKIIIDGEKGIVYKYGK